MTEEEPPTGAPADAQEIRLTDALTHRYMQGGARAFLPSLARLLEAALPDAVQVKRRGLLGRGNRLILRIEVLVAGAVAGDATRYVIEHLGRGPLTATRTSLAGGVASRTETVAVPDWIGAVGAAVAARARQSEAADAALRRFLSGHGAS